MTERPSEITRRELLGTLARWTVPTVVSITLGARVLEAKASCPPCQKKVAGVCRACSVSQILNCQCEPCLGPPYCSAVGPAAPAQPGALMQQSPSQRPPGQAPGGTSQSPSLAPSYGRPSSRDPFAQPLYRDPFGLEGTGFGSRNPQSQGLYQRLRPDTLAPRRVP